MNSDLFGKGILRVPREPKKPKAKPKAAAQPFWTGTSPKFGKLVIVKKIDSAKNEFAALCVATLSGAGGPQLCQASALSVRGNFDMGVELMKTVAAKIVADDIGDKKEVNPIRDSIRETDFQDRIKALPEFQPKPKPQKPKDATGAAAIDEASEPPCAEEGAT